MNVKKKTSPFLEGAKIGFPIGLGYFAVAFSLGITAKKAGLNAFTATLTSLLLNASAGEYAAFSLIAVNASYFEIAIMEAIANARYLLMSCALSQKLSEKTTIFHRMIMGFAVTDELFGASIAQKGYVNPSFYFGMISIAMPCWAGGTGLGVIVGNILPAILVSALGVSLYGMFLAIIIPPARKQKIILVLVVVSMLLSFLCTILPYLNEISEGTRTIILTILISGIAAYLFPVKETDNEEVSA